MEPPWNIGFTCPRHSKTPDPQYFTKPLEFFIGNYVKLAFETGHPKHQKELMWVKVLSKAETEGEELRGEVSNDPIFALNWPCGTWLEFKRTEIIEFQREGSARS